MPNRERLDRQQAWPLWQAALVLVLFCFFMVAPAAPERWADLYSFYGKALVFGLTALFFYLRRFDYPWQIRLVALYALWLMITRILNTDRYMVREPDLVLTKFMLVPVISWAMLLGEKGRRRFMDVFSAAVGGFYLVGGLMALWANLMDTYFYLPPEGVLFGLDGSWHIHYLNIFNTNRTISALWSYIALCLMIYQFFACRNRLWRIPISLAAVMFYVFIALSFARMTMLITALSLAMLAMLLALKYLPAKRLWQRCAALALCLLIVFPLAHKGFDWTGSLMTQVSSLMLSSSAQGEGEAEEEVAGVDLTDDRDMGQDMSNLSERGQIFASFLPSLKLEPKRIFIGSFVDKLMDAPNKFVDFPIPFTHMHNFLLQVFMLTGAPGFLIVLAFTIGLVLRMLHLFFTRDPRAKLEHKILTIPLTGILLYGMGEIVIFTDCGDRRAPTDTRELSFFIIAGLVLALSYELLPSLRKKK